MNKRPWLIDCVLFCVLLIFGVLCSFAIDLANVKPIAAIALFGGIAFRRAIFAFACPLVLIAMTIWGPGSASWPIQLCIAAGLLSSFAFGRLLCQGVRRDLRQKAFVAPALRVTLASVLGSLAFFFISNGAWWQFSNLYPPSVEGLTACFVAGLPFLANTLLGDLLFSAMLFSAAACVVSQPIKSAIWIAFKAAPLRS